MTGADEPTLRDLLRDCRLGDEAAARALYARVAPHMRAYGRAILGDGALAEDAAQQAFLRMLREPIAKIEGVTQPLAWLISLVRSEALTMLRTRSRAQRRDAFHQPAGARTSGDDAEELRVAITRLAPAHRELLVLKHVSELSFDEISLAVGLNRTTTAIRYRSAVEALRRELARMERQEVGCA